MQKAKGRSVAQKSRTKANDKGRGTTAKATIVTIAAEGKAGKPATETAKTDALTEETPKDFVEVRKNIANLVCASASAIAGGMIEAAKKGQLAQAKYLFEAVGLYPPTAETGSRPEDSLAYILLKRMGLPTEPVIREEDAEPGVSADEVKAVSESCRTARAADDPR